MMIMMMMARPHRTAENYSQLTTLLSGSSVRERRMVRIVMKTRSVVRLRSASSADLRVVSVHLEVRAVYRERGSF